MSGDMFPQGYIDYVLTRQGNVDQLAALIREVDGDHSKGAGALAEALIDKGVGVTDAAKTYEYAIAPPQNEKGGVWYMLTAYMQSVGFRLVRREVVPGEPVRMADKRPGWVEIS